MSVRRWVLAALLVVGACGRPATRVRIKPPASRGSVTRSFGWTEEDAPQAVPTTVLLVRPTTQRASRDYQRPRPLPSGDAKAFIYNHESGNNPTRHNAVGCRGLGQACPGSKLPCSDTDYACQDNWFTGYMLTHYHTWDLAEAHWISRAYHCGTDWCGGSW